MLPCTGLLLGLYLLSVLRAFDLSNYLRNVAGG
jgi:hypothetical protein